MRTKFAAICLFILLSLTAFAQSDRGTITGTVADPAGAVVPNAQVEARNTGTGSVYQAASSATGNYTLPSLPIGTYELTVTVPGFKKYVRPDITVQVATTVRIDPQLEVGAATESITVTGEVSQLKTESGELSHIIGTSRLNNLPAITVAGGVGLGNIRNPLQAVTLLPGAQFSNDNTLRINGMPSSSQAVRIEGQDATNGLYRQVGQAVQAGVDSIQEVAVQTSNYAAEYGQAGGGYFNYTMKSGGNQYHGSAYDYIANEFLNSPIPFTRSPEGNHIKNKQRRNDYGFTIGGPIAIPKIYDGHDKSFFFFNFEQFRESQVISNGLTTVPAAAYLNGDFSGALLPQLTLPNPAGGARIPAVDGLGRPVFQNAVYDPTSNKVAPDGTVVRDQFPGNFVPVDKRDPVALKVQALIPTANRTGAVLNYAIPAYSNFRHTTIPSFKLDHNFSAAVKMSMYYSENRQISPSANGFTQSFTPALPQDQISRTTRVNYDHTVTPSMLLHLGIGLLVTNIPQEPPDFDQSTLFGDKGFYINKFPGVAGQFNPQLGGSAVGMGSGFMYAYSRDIKPTANASLSWVKGNHTFKFGGEMVVEGLPTKNYSRANGLFNFGAEQSANPWQNGQPLSVPNGTGFAYASFMMGRANGLQLSRVTDIRLGNHALGFYAQDTWKVTRKLTLDYGLRYDFVTLLKEQYGRMPSAGFNTPNPVAANRLGTVLYEATCGCSFNRNYKFAFGPRLGMAYQIDTKTVLRAGVGVAYSSAPNNAFLNISVADFYQFAPPAYAEPAALLVDGNPYAKGNRFGNPELQWPDFSPHYPALQAPGVRPPQGVFISIDRNAGRPPRILQWSIGLQREIARNLVVEVSYVGNRGAYWTGPLLAAQNYNGLTPEGLLKNYGLNIADPTDRGLLTQNLLVPSAGGLVPNPAIANRGGLAFFSNPNNVYPGFGNQSLNQALRDFPQWLGVPPFLGPPLGRTWYDSLQATATKRYSNGLDVNAAFTWQKELNLGVGSDSSYVTPAPNIINDVFNRNQNKQLSGFSRPLMFVLSFNYTTPGFSTDSRGFKVLSHLVQDWTIGGLLRYQSGQVIRTAGANNGLMSQLKRQDNPAVWGGANTPQNRVAGQPLLNFDPNCKCFDPTTQLVLNPAAFSDALPGQFGTAAPYYNDYRWQRQPAEAFNIGRIFRLVPEKNITLQVRAEFFNAFNRTFLSSPSGVNPGNFFGPGPGPNPSAPTVRDAAGQLTGGYGFVDTRNGLGTSPRTGQLVARFSF